MNINKQELTKFGYKNMRIKGDILHTTMATLAIALSFICFDTFAQERFGTVEFDKTTHDFGDVMLNDGPLRCTFTVKNIGSSPIAIYSVTTSCGCTNVKWTKQPIHPGKTGTISATYTNDEGPYPFDKGLTVKISGINRPIILKLRGVSHEKKQSPEELYTLRSGAFGMKSADLKCGNLEQGESRSDRVNVANLSQKPVHVAFDEISDGLSLRITPNPIPAGGTAELIYTISSRKEIYGKHCYHAVPVVDGRKYPENRLNISAFTKENFSQMSATQKAEAPKPMFKTSSFSFGKIPAGKPVDATFTFTNNGKNEFIAYKVDIDAAGATHTQVPRLKNGQTGSFSVHIDTKGLPKGEALIIVTLTTNAPSRPIINLFITGWIE